jgi:hypothetical protein
MGLLRKGYKIRPKGKKKFLKHPGKDNIKFISWRLGVDKIMETQGN